MEIADAKRPVMQCKLVISGDCFMKREPTRNPLYNLPTHSPPPPSLDIQFNYIAKHDYLTYKRYSISSKI